MAQASAAFGGPRLSPVTAVADAPARGARRDTTTWAERLVTPLPDDRARGWVVTLLVGAFAAWFRFHDLGRLLWTVDPNNSKVTGYLTGTYKDSGGCVRYFQDVFDETYYHHDALSLLHHGVESNCQNTAAGFVVQPPLGKWMIGGGIELFGDNPFGWRFAGALVGTLAVVIMVRVARRMFSSTLLGGFAGLLLAGDGLELVLSRTGILDIFLLFWLMVAVGCLVLDRHWGRVRMARRLDAGGSTAWPGPRLGFRPWRLATAVALGAAIGVKWDGLFWVPAFALMTFLWDVGLRRAADVPRPVWAAVRRDWLGWVPSFTVVPAGIYTATWTGWFLTPNAWAWDRSNYQSQVTGVTYDRSGFFGSIGNWLSYQCDAYNFAKNLTDNVHVGGGYMIPLVDFCYDKPVLHNPGNLHPYLSKPFSWLLLGRPVAFYAEQPPTGQDGCHARTCEAEVIALGNPAIWWLAIPMLLVLIGLWFAWRDWRALMILVLFACTFVPWLFYESRQMFFYYALPCLPFIVLGLTMVAGWVLGPPGADGTRRLYGAWGVGAYAVLVLVLFFFFLPILTGVTLPYDHWHWRIWFPGWI